MAEVTTGARDFISVDQGAHTASYNMHGSFTGEVQSTVTRRLDYYLDAVLVATGLHGQVSTLNTSWNSYTNGQIPKNLVADEDGYSWKARVTSNIYGSLVGALKYFKTHAVTATASTPSSSAVTFETATIACNYYPNVNVSSCSAQLQYKKTADPGWTNAGSPVTDGGYSQASASEDITGLDASTQYQFRLVITRTTENETSLTSAVSSFTTEAGVPDLTTDAVTNIAATTAILHGTLVINEGTGVNVYFKWDENTPPVANQTANQSKSADDSFQQAISGLSYNTLYYFQAFTSFSSPAGSPLSGSILSFTTAADPSAKIGSFWVEDVRVDWVDTNRFVKSSTGVDLGLQAGAKKASIWVEGDNLHYIDDDNHERRINGILGDVVAGLPGSIWVQAVVHQLRWITEVTNKEASMAAF